MKHLTMSELEDGLASIRRSPRDAGVLKLIVRRPHVDGREVVERAELDTTEGLVGDSWSGRGSSQTENGSAHPGMQLTIMNTRVIDLLAQDIRHWPLAGDQLYVDMDLSRDSLPPGIQLSLGSAIVEVTAQPHTGCDKFVTRFGLDAVKWVNSSVGRELCLRGINARVVRSGAIRTNETLKRIQEAHT